MTAWLALSLWEPWATALVQPDGPKTIETRGYGTAHRGPVIILAAQHKLTQRERAELPASVDTWYDANLAAGTLHHGHAVGVGWLADVVNAESIEWHEAFFNRAHPNPQVRAWWPDQVGDERTGRVFVHPDERPWGGYGPGRKAWLFDRLVQFGEPIPAKGHQGPRTAAPELVAAVEEELAVLEWR